MANIVITFSTTAAQDAKLAKVLSAVNAERAAQDPPLDPFSTPQDYFKFIITETVKAYVQEQNRRDAASIAEAYDAANASVKGQVESLLGLSL